jgi:ABC-type transport system involved in multi-copper enzyme maturation permease subunit
MPSRVAAVRAWLRRTFAWSNTPRAWAERLSLAGVAAAAAALLALGGRLGAAGLTAAWAALAVAAAVLFRRGWLPLFGPVLRYDLVRTARRARTYFVRTGYLLALLTVIGLMYLNAAPGRAPGRPSIGELADFGGRVFWTFAGAQFVLIVLLAPAYTAGAVAEERQKKTLPFLLATDLRNREIVLGKLLSRLAHLGLLLLAGLPVLGLVQLLGGVDPHLVLAAFAGTALAAASAAGVGLLASVVARPSRAAVFLAYAFVVAYVFLCLLALAVPYWLAVRPGAASVPPWLKDLLDQSAEVIDAGNPFVAVWRVLNSGDPPEEVLLRGLRGFALFHGGVAAGCALAATALLRKAALRGPRAPAVRERRAHGRAAVGDWPMVWKEVHSGRGASRWLVALLMGLLIGATLLPLYWVINDPSPSPFTPEGYWHRLAAALNAWERTVGTTLACLALVGVALRAAYSVRTERERETLDGLLTTPLTTEDILGAKWLGAVLSARGLLAWLAFVWGLAVLGGGLSLAAVPLLALAWAAYAAAAASVGLWFSVVSRSSLRAALHTVLAGLVLCFGHWLVWLVCFPLRFWPGGAAAWVVKLQVGLTPPAALAAAAFHAGDYVELFPFLLAGAACWVLFAWGVWRAAAARFRRQFGRE